jgi:hypothetical protein
MSRSGRFPFAFPRQKDKPRVRFGPTSNGGCPKLVETGDKTEPITQTCSTCNSLLQFDLIKDQDHVYYNICDTDAFWFCNMGRSNSYHGDNIKFDFLQGNAVHFSNCPRIFPLHYYSMSGKRQIAHVKAMHGRTLPLRIHSLDKIC